MIFHKKQKKLPPHFETLGLYDVIIKKVENVKFLGVLLDQYISWNEQISSVAMKLVKYVLIMYASRQYCSK